MTEKLSERSSRMFKLSRSHLGVLAATAAAAVGGTAVAVAADRGSSATKAQRSADGRGAGETPLTGTTKDKVQEAALAKVDGAVLRIETDNGGAYEAHIRKADGTEAEVKVNKAFEVTAVNEFDGDHRGRGGHGPGPGWHADLAAVASKLGVTAAKLQSALESARPTGSPNERGDRRADRAAALAKALGVEASKVQDIVEANRPQHDSYRGRASGRPDDSALVSALAKGLSKSEAEVRSALDKAEQAHRAEHDAREAAVYAAVAKALGKDAADVKAAFEAARPTR
jgi:uncharacterized membrane protein YkoI